MEPVISGLNRVLELESVQNEGLETTVAAEVSFKRKKAERPLILLNRLPRYIYIYTPKPAAFHARHHLVA